ncbi:MAG TPA: amino acid ABC transporter permease [Candidatus Tumulicola sp.]|nr:amino acid ABC transporter permease [Candidatus Tumulicola sp.]
MTLRGFTVLFDPANLRFLWWGFEVTLQIAVWTIALSLAGGLVLGVARFAGENARGNPALRIVGILAGFYIELFRNLPMLLIMLAARFWSHLHPVPAAIAGMSLYTAAVMAEIVRAGLNGVGRSQWEASAAQGFTYLQTLRYVILPQGLRKVIPPLVGQFITVVKDTSYAWGLGVQEITGSGTIIFAKYLNPMETFTLIGLVYFVTNFSMALAARGLERRLARRTY